MISRNFRPHWGWACARNCPTRLGCYQIDSHDHYDYSRWCSASPREISRHRPLEPPATRWRRTAAWTSSGDQVCSSAKSAHMGLMSSGGSLWGSIFWTVWALFLEIYSGDLSLGIHSGTPSDLHTVHHRRHAKDAVPHQQGAPALHTNLI